MTALATDRDLGFAPEPVVARDMVRRAVVAAPVLVALGALGWGTAGAASAAFSFVLVLANFLVAAWLLATAARISYAALIGVALFGFAVRLGLVSAAVLAVRDASWAEPVVLGLTLVIAHLGLLFWELRFLSISLAHPALPPSRKETSSR